MLKRFNRFELQNLYVKNMYTSFKKCMLVIFMMLKLCANRAGGIVPCDLAIVCGISDGTTTIQTIPNSCTAVAVTKDIGNMNNVKSIIKDLPFVLIDNSITFEQWPDIISADPKNYINNLLSFDFSVIIFDNLYKEGVNSVNQTFNTALANFLDILKTDQPDMLFGILVPSKDELQKSCLDFKFIESHVDLFLIDTTWYRECDYQNHQRDMSPMVKIDDIKYTVGQLNSIGMSTCKMMITMQIRVFSVKKIIRTTHDDDITYVKLCQKGMSVHRKFCIDTSETAFDKARFSYQQNMVGIFVKDINYDDINGTCACAAKDGSGPNFPLLKIIAGSSANDYEPVENFMCIDKDFPSI